MIAMLSHIKHSEGSAVLHVKTVKGKGYTPAEKDPNAYHGLLPKGRSAPAMTFSRAMGEALCTLAQEDERICAITAAMRDGTGLVPFSEKYPKRFFDVGIAEGHALTFAAGLASANIRPVVALYSTFLQRGYDNILHDIALQHLPVTLCIDRAGLNAGDGPTHHGVFDVAMLSAVSDATVYAPVTLAGVARALRASMTKETLCALRYPSGEPDAAILQAFYPQGEEDVVPTVRVWESGEEPLVTVLTHGRIVTEALAAAKALAKEGIAVRILLCEQIAPYGVVAARVAPHLCGDLLFLEEEIRAGGFGQNLSDALMRRGALVGRRYEIMALETGFIATRHGEQLWQTAGLDATQIQKTLCRLADRKKGEKLC
jgi:1-deoxy-D-xylulose-5-phosphate synthase